MAAQITVIPRAEQLRDRDRKAVAHTDDKAEDQIVDRPGRADRGQCTDAAEAADNDSVRQRIELLEQIAQHQRQRKHQNNFERTAAREVFRHNFPLPQLYTCKISCGLYYSTHACKCKRINHANFAIFGANKPKAFPFGGRWPRRAG